MKTLDRRLTALEERARPNPPSISRSLPCFYGNCEHGPECRRQGLRGLAAFYGIHEEKAVEEWWQKGWRTTICPRPAHLNRSSSREST